jgi:hypothetical protein
MGAGIDGELVLEILNGVVTVDICTTVAPCSIATRAT